MLCLTICLQELSHPGWGGSTRVPNNADYGTFEAPLNQANDDPVMPAHVNRYLLPLFVENQCATQYQIPTALHMFVGVISHVYCHRIPRSD